METQPATGNSEQHERVAEDAVSHSVAGSVVSHADLGGRFGRTRMPRRSLKAIPPKLYRIGELVEYSGVSRQTIHNYTTMGLLIESRWTQGGHRLYDESVFARLDQIAEFKAEHRAMEYIRQHFVGQDAQAIADSGART